MRSVSVVSFVSLLVVVIGFMSDRAALAQPTQDGQVINAYTQPSKRLELAFNGLGVIQEVMVKEGDAVKVGQPLIAQDQEIEALELERLKSEADSKARVEAAEADLNVKKKVFERKSKAGPGVYNLAEIEEAELDVTFRDKQLLIAMLENSQNKIKARQQQAKLDRMKLTSKIDGLVEKIEVWEGEMSDPSKAAIIVVKNDPMYVLLKDLNTRQVSRLSVGEVLEVKYPDEPTWQKAKIIFISPVADAASDRQFVRLEMPNQDNRATGLPIQVKLPPRLQEAQASDKTAVNR